MQQAINEPNIEILKKNKKTASANPFSAIKIWYLRFY